MMLDNIHDNTLIICPNCYKDKILNYLTEKKLIINIKFMTIEEYKKNYFFDYDIKTIKYLVDKYHIKVSNAKEIINNLYYVSIILYQREKLDYLVRIKKELDENNLLIYNPLFDKYLSWEKIVIGYGNLNKYDLCILENCNIVDYEKLNNKFHIMHTNTINEEIEYVFNKIIDLLNDGVDINKIYLMNVNDEYYSYLKRFSMFYHIPLNLSNNEKIIGTTLGSTFYQMILDKYSHEDIYDYLIKYQEEDLFSVLLSILNKYIEYDLYEVRDLIYEELINKKIPDKKYKNVINLIDVFDYVDDDSYIFLMNFNNNSIPRIYDDTDYINDSLCDLVNKPKCEELNELERNNTINYLSSIKNLFISYKDQTPFNKYFPSSLLDYIDYEEEEYVGSFNYSDKYNQVRFIDMLDNYLKYGLYDENMESLYNTYGNLEYQEYVNDYHNINKEDLLEFLDNKLTLSYSSIDKYYKCAFQYYLGNILKVDLYEQNFQAIVGDLFHQVLSHYHDKDFDLDKCYNEISSHYELDNKERFFIDKLKLDLKYIIDVINDLYNLSGLKQELYEEKINLTLKEKPYVEFKGFVDKIMYQEKDNETLVSIIDYKTNNPDIKLDKLPFGLSMQLPIYLYLIEKSNLFDNPKIVGFYLQNILNSKINISDKKTYDEQRRDSLKLNGYSTSNKDYLSIFDKTYEDSEMISGLKTNKDGSFSRYSRIVTDEDIKRIVEIIDKNIKEAFDDILNGKFTINPKIINGINESCKYCKYQDICYLEEKDKVYLNTEEGDDDGDRGTEISD